MNRSNGLPIPLKVMVRQGGDAVNDDMGEGLRTRGAHHVVCGDVGRGTSKDFFSPMGLRLVREEGIDEHQGIVIDEVDLVLQLCERRGRLDVAVHYRRVA